MENNSSLVRIYFVIFFIMSVNLKAQDFSFSYGKANASLMLYNGVLDQYYHEFYNGTAFDYDDKPTQISGDRFSLLYTTKFHSIKWESGFTYFSLYNQDPIFKDHLPQNEMKGNNFVVIQSSLLLPAWKIKKANFRLGLIFSQRKLPEWNIYAYSKDSYGYTTSDNFIFKSNTFFSLGIILGQRFEWPISKKNNMFVDFDYMIMSTGNVYTVYSVKNQLSVVEAPKPGTCNMVSLALGITFNTKNPKQL